MIQHDSGFWGFLLVAGGEVASDTRSGKRPSTNPRSKRTRSITALSQRWALVVMQCLIGGPKRFNEISKETGVNPNTLRERLRDFETLGLVRRTVNSETPPNVEYGLTPRAEELAVILDRLFEWASHTNAQAVVQIEE